MYLVQNQVCGTTEVLKIRFNSQEEANKYFEEMEKLADRVCDEQSAIKMIEMVEICYENQEEYFIPAIVLVYEEMALSYIENYKIVG